MVLSLSIFLFVAVVVVVAASLSFFIVELLVFIYQFDTDGLFVLLRYFQLSCFCFIV